MSTALSWQAVDDFISNIEVRSVSDNQYPAVRPGAAGRSRLWIASVCSSISAILLRFFIKLHFSRDSNQIERKVTGLLRLPFIV
jgi:hypothetical protein